MLAFLQSLLPLELQRKIAYDKAPEGALKDYLAVPFPEPSLSIGELPILSVDFETTGLNAVHDQLLSIGFVVLNQGRIELGSCDHQIIKTKGKLTAKNVCVHQITDDEKDRGIQLKSAVDNLLHAMAGKVLLVHYAKIERLFLRQACLEIYGVVPPFLMIDTLAIAKKRLDRQGKHYDPSTLRLVNLRESFQLPNYNAHNALNDAIATAELLLAEIMQYKQGLNTRLSQLL